MLPIAEKQRLIPGVHPDYRDIGKAKRQIQRTSTVQTGMSIIMTEEMHSECKQDNVVDYVHENCVDRRASHSAYVPVAIPKRKV